MRRQFGNADWLHERLGKLRAVLPELPVQAEELVEVVPPTPGELVQAGYLAQVRDIAPERLVGREEELAELVQFCAGEERYQWWQAAPWAGKSALAAWFVLHPPDGVAVVSFFVTGRLAGQADSDAFTEAMVEQLAAVAGEAALRPATPGGWDRKRRRLLDLAAANLGGRGGRLVLVIDGLDEDEGAKPGGKPSIASLLPKRPPTSVRVLVLSRPSPGLAGDVPGDHPLRQCARRELTPWSSAQDVRLQAKQELLEQLHGDQLQVDVIGFITAAGGGLTLTELVELIRQPLYRLDGTLASVFGRSLRTRVPTGRPPDGDAERIYLFAHETLRVIAEEELAGSLDSYRQRIDAWADEYRARGWPERTPRYLLRPYGRLLGSSGDLQRLVDFATDSGRHDRLLASTLGDGAAIAEITTAQQLLLAQPAPDLGALGRLAVHRDRLANRNQTLPVELPALLVRLGQRQRGEAFARSIPSPGQAEALAAVADALAAAGRWDRAEETARGISDDGFRARALAAVGKAMIEADRDRALGLLDDADQVARGVHRDYVRPFVLAAVAEAFADAGLWERAEQTAHAIDPLYAAAGARALRSVVESLANAGRWDRAEQTARAIPSRWATAAALATIASALVDHDRDRALALLDSAERIARTHFPSGDDAEPLRAILEAMSVIDRDRAIRLAADVEQVARSIPHPAGKDDALRGVAKALAETGLWDHADRVARSIAAAVVRTDATRAVAQVLATGGQWNRAEQTARSIPDPRGRAEALIAVAKALIGHDQDRALALAVDAEQTARGIPHPGRFWALQALARAQAAAGQLELAEQSAHSLSHPGLALRAVAQAQAAAGQWERAERTARAITDPDTRTRALAGVAKAMTEPRRSSRVASGTAPSRSPEPSPNPRPRSEPWPQWPRRLSRSTRTAP